MIIIGIALGAGVLTFVVFFLLDRSKKDDSQASQQRSDQESAGHSKSNDSGLTDYSTYNMSVNEKALYIALAALGLLVIGFIFYNNLIVAIILAGLSIWFPKIQVKSLIKKRKQELAMQFKQTLYSLGSSLAAGRSVENSFKEVAKDLRLLYPDPSTDIIRELDIINFRVENGEPIEEALLDLSKRADIEDITNFTDVFTTCKRKGGNLNEVIRRTSNIIGEKLEIKQEIMVLVSQKRFEAQVIILAPFAIVALLNISSPDYMEPLYKLSSGGPIIMTLALVLLGLCFAGVQKIMDIKV